MKTPVVRVEPDAQLALPLDLAPRRSVPEWDLAVDAAYALRENSRRRVEAIRRRMLRDAGVDVDEGGDV